jgi:hypothetical protein
MTDQHPITPPPELVREWNQEATGIHFEPYGYSEFITTRAAQWGADQELAACCEWLKDFPHFVGIEEQLRPARRPKPSLKEQALEAWEIANQSWTTISDKEVAIIIRRALEALDD